MNNDERFLGNCVNTKGGKKWIGQPRKAPKLVKLMRPKIEKLKDLIKFFWWGNGYFETKKEWEDKLEEIFLDTVKLAKKEAREDILDEINNLYEENPKHGALLMLRGWILKEEE